MKKTWLFLVLAVFIVISIFGMPLMLGSPAYAGMECPFMSGQTVMCAASTLLEHVRHWQSAFAGILFELLALGLLVLYFRKPLFSTAPDTGQVAWRMQQRTPVRPTLFQELYARGILNRKEPHLFFVR